MRFNIAGNEVRIWDIFNLMNGYTSKNLDTQSLSVGLPAKLALKAHLWKDCPEWFNTAKNKSSKVPTSLGRDQIYSRTVVFLMRTKVNVRDQMEFLFLYHRYVDA